MANRGGVYKPKPSSRKSKEELASKQRKKMKSSFCSISAPLLFLVLLGLSSANASIEKVCEKAMQGTGYEKFCVTTLKSAANGEDDGQLALAKVAMELVNKTFNDNLDKIEALLKKKDLPELSHEAVDICQRVYGTGLMKMVQAGQHFELEDFEGTSDYLNNARDEVVSCADAITAAGIVSPLKEENDNALKLCSVAIHVEGTLT